MHGGIDGYSRLVVYLRSAPNNLSATVLESFLNAVSLYGLPKRVRSDQGVENVKVSGHLLIQIMQILWILCAVVHVELHVGVATVQSPGFTATPAAYTGIQGLGN